MEGILKVSPEDLTNTAAVFSTCGTTIRNITASMTETVHSLSSAYQGDDATAYFAKFNSLQDDIERIHGMIQEHVTDLNEIARNFIKAMSENRAESEGLPGDVVS